MSDESDAKRNKMQIFRASEAPELMEANIMSLAPSTEVQAAGMAGLVDAGFIEGGDTRVLFNQPGFSLLKVWFKKDYPLVLHSHDADCLYYIVAGSIKLGTEALGPGDGFFIEADVPYTYTPGPEGVELLEFRHATEFNFVNHARSEAFYGKAEKVVTDNIAGWRQARPPSEQ